MSEAIGHGSHAEGVMVEIPTRAYGPGSHAEGYGTQTGDVGSTIGRGAHSEGGYTNAMGDYSHAEGLQSEALGNQSHAGGESTIASGTNQTAIGKFNIDNPDDTETGYAFIIGNGIDNDNRSDAFAVTWGGDIYSATGKQLSDENFTHAEKIALANKLDKIFITNLVGNGDFPNTTGWVGANATLSAVDKTLISTVTSPSTSWAARYYYNTNTNMLASHKYYVKCRARITTPDCYGMYIQLRQPTLEILSQIASMAPYSGGSPIENQWYEISGIDSLSTTSVGMMFYAIHEYPDDATAALGQMELKNAIIIDLTAAFGVGNEPTVSQMDQLISYYNNDYVSTADNSYISSQHDISDLRDALAGKLTTVSTDTTLTGDGTPSNPLSVVASSSFDLSTPTDWDTIKYNPGTVKWEAKPDSYVHTQTVVSDTWVIVHNLHKYPSVHVFDSFNFEVVGGVVHDSLIQMTITFTGSFSGVAYLN
jgi:hypothetical protein